MWGLFTMLLCNLSAADFSMILQAHVSEIAAILEAVFCLLFFLYLAGFCSANGHCHQYYSLCANSVMIIVLCYMYCYIK